MIYKLVLSLICCLSCQYALTQEIGGFRLIPGSKVRSTDGWTTGKFHQFEHVFNTSPDQATMFSKFNYNMKVQIWSNFMAGGVS